MWTRTRKMVQSGVAHESFDHELRDGCGDREAGGLEPDPLQVPAPEMPLLAATPLLCSPQKAEKMEPPGESLDVGHAQLLEVQL